MNVIEFSLSIITFPVLMQLVSLLFLFVLLSYLVKTRKQRMKDYHDIVELRRDLRALTSAALGVGDRVHRVEKQQKNEKYSSLNPGKFNAIEKVVTMNAIKDPAYEDAIHLVKNGADVNELVNTCGLSQGEADLVNLLHKITDINTKKRMSG